ncbi:MAG: hypothetical protein K0R81_2072 [Microbacterium sp.]|nr:hypothetical protein [Microbacterium sp.]
MTSTGGEIARGSWEFLDIDAPRGFEVVDSFVDENGDALPGTPAMRMTFAFDETETGSRLTNITYFDSLDGFEQVLAMGAAEGATLAMNQLDVVLAGLREFAQGKGTRLEVLSDQHVRITRLIDGPRDLVWRAHVEPDLMRQWMLGPDGWRMSISEVDFSVGGTYRIAWEPETGTEGEGFGFDGATLLIDPGHPADRVSGCRHPRHRTRHGHGRGDGAELPADGARGRRLIHGCRGLRVAASGSLDSDEGSGFGCRGWVDPILLSRSDSAR